MKRRETTHGIKSLARRYLLAAGGALGLLGRAAQAQGGPSLAERKKKIQSLEGSIAPEALQRKARSEAVLRAEGVPVNSGLPVIEIEGEALRRPVDEVAYRALALLVVAVKGEGLEQPVVERIVKDYGLARHFSPKEQAFVRNAAPSQHDRVQFAWRYEAAWVMLWALGYVDKLEKPTAICNVPHAVNTMKQRSASKFVADAKLRPLAEILDQADRIYRYHWAVVEARVKNAKAPAGLEAGVTLERHYALNWLIGYLGQAWDDISTDT